MYLLDNYPQLRDLPYQPLCRFPSPLRRLSHVSAAASEVGGRPTEVFLKDDGLISSVYSGNKARKLEFILGDALARGRAEVWTVGGVGSHHVLATALHSQELGMRCRAFHVPQPLNNHVLDNLSALLTTHPHLTLAQTRTCELPSPKNFKRQLTDWLSQSKDPYFIPPGGSSLMGTLGYINAGLEIAQQIESGLIPAPDAIYLAAGTCSTLAGLVLGLKLARQPIEVVGVQVVPDYIANLYVIQRLIRQGVDYLQERGIHIDPADLSQNVTLLTGHLGGGYGHATSAGAVAQDIAKRDHWRVDPIYTAKALGGLLEQERGRGRRVVFWNTLSAVNLTCRVKRGDWRHHFDRLPESYRTLLNQHL